MSVISEGRDFDQKLRSPVTIMGVFGRQLRGQLVQGVNGNPDDPVALILPPRGPGAAENWARQELVQICFHHAFSVLDINYKYESKLKDKVEEPSGNNSPAILSDIEDAKLALKWLRKKYDMAKQCWVIGIEYGAHIAMQMVMRDTGVTGFVVVSLPEKYDLNFLSPCPARGLIVHGQNNQFVTCKALKKFVDDRNLSNATTKAHMGASIDFAPIPGAGKEFITPNAQQAFTEKVSKYLQNFHAARNT